MKNTQRQSPVDRPVSSQEKDLLVNCLVRAAKRDLSEEILRSVPNLRVNEECLCGCGSIGFRITEEGAPEEMLANGVVDLQSGGTADLIVWGKGKEISYFEIVLPDPATGEGPIPETVRSWENYWKVGEEEKN